MEPGNLTPANGNRIARDRVRTGLRPDQERGAGRLNQLASRLPFAARLGESEIVRPGAGCRENGRRAAGPAPGIATPPTPRWKRMLDLVLIVLSLPLWLPLMILLAAATWVLSPGPIIFRQERIGLGGRRFAMYKFRTMTVDAGSAEHADHVRHLVESDRPLSKLDEAGDSRLIRFGRVIRASGLDELPQILNVLRGEMSLIGPRPCLPGEADLFDRWHAERMLAMPGITGLWQVSGKNKTTFSQMIALDIEYRRRLSPALDLSILVRTIPAIVAQIRDLTGGSMTRQGHPLSHRYTDVAGELPAK